MDYVSYPTKIWVGNQSLERLAAFTKERILIVTDEGMYKLPGFQLVIEKISEDNDIQIFSKVIPDPPIEVIISGIETMSHSGPTVILAIGGGSVIDAAKGIKFFAQKAGVIDQAILIAVPTTSGAGSEVTNFSVS